jgi:hypothetical protein
MIQIDVHLIIWIGGFAMSCFMAYQSYDSFRSAFTGTQPKTSAPDNNPRTALIGGIALGLITGALSLFGFWWLFFR